MTQTMFHGANAQHKTLKAAKCELSYPAGVWLAETHSKASNYAARHTTGAVAEVSVDTTGMADFESYIDMNGEDKCPVTTARKIKRAGYSGILFSNGDALVFKAKAITITGWTAPAANTRSMVANRCSCH